MWSFKLITITIITGFLSTCTWCIANNYQCIDSYCICLDSQCETDCANGFCQNKDFICTANVTRCSFDCKDINSCKHSTFYMASTHFEINCTASNSCNDINIHCGIPQTIPYQFTSNDFHHNMQTCGISAFNSSSINNSHISCTGNIEHCSIESSTSETEVIIDSEFQCNVNIGQCNLNCNSGCTQSFYSCNTAHHDQCQCLGCHSNVTFIETSTNKISSTYILGQNVIINVDTEDNDSDTQQIAEINNKTTIILSDRNVFDLTDGVITNLEVLYYIVLGAGGCLCCCICLCISVVCFVRKSIQRDDDSKLFEKTPTISTFGLNGSDVPSNDPSIDTPLPLSQSGNSRSIKNKKRHKLHPFGNSNSASSSSSDTDITIHNESEEKAEMDESINTINNTPDSFKVVYNTNSSTPSLEPLPHIIELKDSKSNSIHSSPSQQNEKRLKITLTKPINDRKSHKKRRRGKHCKTSKSKHIKSPILTPKPSLSPNSTQPSLSNPDPNEGTTMHERMMSSASSECNLASKIDHDRATQQRRQQQQFNVIQDLHNPFACNSVRRQIAYAAQQRQILFTQHQQNNQQNRRKNPFTPNNSSYNNHNNNNRHRSNQPNPPSQPPQPPQLQMIKPSMRHKHTATPSNPTLPVIDSEATVNHTQHDPNFSVFSMDEITNTDVVMNTAHEPSRHRYTSSAASSASNATSNTSNSSASASSSSSASSDSESYATYTDDTCSCSDCHDGSEEDEPCDQCSCHRYQGRPKNNDDDNNGNIKQTQYNALSVDYNPSSVHRSSQCSTSSASSVASSSSHCSSSVCSHCSSVTDSDSSSDNDTEFTGTVTSIATSKRSKGSGGRRQYKGKKMRVHGHGPHRVVIHNMHQGDMSDVSANTSCDDEDDDDDQQRDHERFRTIVIHSPNSNNQQDLHYD